MDERVRAHVLVRGRVQGVAFRAYTQERARARALVGGVRNLDDGRVEVFIEGPRTAVLALIEELRVGPPRASVKEVAVEWATPQADDRVFSIWY